MSTQFFKRDELIDDLLNQVKISSTSTIFFHQAIAKHLGLNQTDHKCLELLHRRGSLTAGELAEESNLTTGAITGVIDRLEQAGFARRVKDPNDRRRLLVELVPENIKVIEELFESISQWTVQLLDKYTDEELSIILDYVSRSTKMTMEWTKTLQKKE
ncbi:putative HTH-type transcriptional regulator YcgE [Bacillus sp. J14TS2]|uniref:MarR family transcriptional regulator n=1 Tax=Bacillus sp. J14TS2 TaxID=2807188 RepID=UPI001B0BB1C7|nr:MarR family transcriptional regulator [Bacillus sp. J14TS2]GIN74277.1 putative HTH-type transcriptional regulator YcgE [Bacillus sp. J14TS2]